MWVLIIFLLLRYLSQGRVRDCLQWFVGSVQPSIACMFSFVAEIFDSIDTTKPAILSGAREQESGAMIDTKYLQFRVS